MKLIWKGERALITGGSCDIAIELAKLMIDESLIPVLTYRNSYGKEKIEAALSNFQNKYITCHLDYSDVATLENINGCITQGIDFLVDFAQGDYETLIASAASEKIDSFIAENIGFRAKLIKLLTRSMMVKKNGRLLFISSTAAKLPNTGQGFYAAVKLAAEALYKNTGIELGNRGITTLSLRPGYVNSGRGETYYKNNKKEVLNKIPAGSILTSGEVAETIMFFLSDSARGFNATEIEMDGGLTSGK